MISFYERDTFGSHIGFNKKIEYTYRTAIGMGLYSFQFFLGSNRSYKRTILDKEDIDRTIDLSNKHRLNIYTHCSLLYNLAGSIKNNSLAWKGNSIVDKCMNDIVSGIEYELSVTSKIGCGCGNGCVVHVGSWKDKDEGIKSISETINRICFPKDSTLLLENTAGKGTTIGKTFSDLKKIYSLIDSDKKNNIKICIDTCHIFASGEYNLQTNGEIDRMFNDFDSVFGMDKLGLIHFNDSFYRYGTNGDEHVTIGNGEIWKEHKSSLKYIVEKIDSLKIPLVLETMTSDYNVIQEL